MTESSDHDVVKEMKLQITQLQERNEAPGFNENYPIATSREGRVAHRDLNDPDPQLLSAEIWNAFVPENFKSLSLSSFDGKSRPMEHVTTFNTCMVVVGVADSLKCKLHRGTFRDAALRWYVNLLRFSIVGYHDMTGKLIHQFFDSRHHKEEALRGGGKH